MKQSGYLSDSTRIELFDQFIVLSELLTKASEVLEGIALTLYNSDEEYDYDIDCNK